MKIKGMEGLTVGQLNEELERGGKFVIYQFAFSIVIMTFKRSSNIYFIKEGESAFAKGAKYSLLTFLLGWWGIPWGPIYSIGSIFTNCRGGKDVTDSVLESLNAAAEQEVAS